MGHSSLCALDLHFLLVAEWFIWPLGEGHGDLDLLWGGMWFFLSPRTGRKCSLCKDDFLLCGCRGQTCGTGLGRASAECPRGAIISQLFCSPAGFATRRGALFTWRLWIPCECSTFLSPKCSGTTRPPSLNWKDWPFARESIVNETETYARILGSPPRSQEFIASLAVAEAVLNDPGTGQPLGIPGSVLGLLAGL